MLVKMSTRQKLNKISLDRNCFSFSQICLYIAKIYYIANTVYTDAFKLTIKRNFNIWKGFKGRSVKIKEADNI